MTALIVLGSLLLVAFAILAIAFFLRPLRFLIIASRRKLARSGLERKQLDDLVYWSGGKGPVLVLLHGANDQAGTWYKNVPELMRQYRIIAPDLPGHGESGPAEGELSFELMLTAIEKLVGHEAPGEPVRLAGNSMGGWLALLFTLRHPTLVAGLVLETSGGIEFDAGDLNLAPQTREEARRLASLVWGPDVPRLPGYILADMVRMARTAPVLRFRQTVAEDHLIEEERLNKMKVPTTLVWGDCDGILPPEYAERLRARIPGAKLHVLARCGHIPHREKPAQYTRIVLEALASADANTLTESYAAR